MSSASQYWTVLEKNWLISKRTKEYLRQNMSTLILGVFVVIAEHTQPNNFITPFYMALAVAGYSRTVALTWVNERESRQKELQKIMGLSHFTYILAWLSYYLLNGFLVSLLMMLIFRFGVMSVDEFQFADGYGFWNVVLLYYIYTISIIGFTFLLCNFFSKAKTAAQGVTFIQLVINFLYFLRFSADISNNHALMSFLAVFPQMGFNMGISSIAFINSQFPSPAFQYSDALLSLTIGAAAFLILSLYLDQVWPNQMGTNKHPLFFIDFLRRQDRRRQSEHPLLEDNDDEGQTSAKYQQQLPHENPSLIKIENICKSFGEKEVIRELKMKFYSSEIFCLLGHNGAGKSTTINLLTGLLQPNSGNIKIMGMNYSDDLEQIRKNIGLCLQQNVLYDDLTIEQHLRFYAKIKGIPTQDIERNIEEVRSECALNNERGKLSKNLSGGNKRKLSLANALIGNSNIIFLDEPTSGLDPNSRQGIWDILKSIRSQNRCLILTTHHLEEAEQLSQRIGIMSEGKLVIVGDSNFIKEKFNVGCHVVISFKEKKNTKSLMKECRQIILSRIEGAKQDEQTAAKTLKFIFPMNQAHKFAETFAQLESMASISVKMSNLEDAFIKLGEQQDKNTNIPDIENLVLPNVECRYTFGKQYKAVFIKKALATLRSLSTAVSIILPTIFIVMGVIMVTTAITGDEQVLKWVRRYIMSYFMVWAFVFNTSSYCGSIVEERQKRFKYLASVMGLRKIPYWLGNYTFDLIIFLIPMVVFFILIFILGEKAAFLTDVVGYLIILLILFAFSFISYSYFFSFIFQKSSTAYRFFPFLNLIFFYVLPQIPNFTAPESILAQNIVPLLSPFMAFSDSFFTEQILGDVDVQGVFKSNSLFFNYGALVIQAIVFCSATMLIENLRFNLRDKEILEAQMNEQRINEAQDHVREDAPILINHLSKKYQNGYVAIRDNSFSVDEGEIFGLLGPNGAGKSTTFNIATAAMPKTNGTVKILGHDVDRGMMEIFSHVGVCPQYDAIYDNLTTEEHMHYFARLKGLDDREIEETVKYYYDLMSLGPYVKVKAGVLSGGNKRKLCVSMAMLGNPSIMFFDEPSSGVDPISRRFLWKTLSLSTRTRKTSMVLTTHAMNEAQSLCSRIGILIKGKFVIIATPDELKRKYGKGFRVSIHAPLQKHQQIIRELTEQFKGQVTQDKLENQNQEDLYFVIDSDVFCFSKAYHMCQNNFLERGKITRYQINESSLEQVFLFLSQMQPPVDEDQKFNEPWELLCWEWGDAGCHCMI